MKRLKCSLSWAALAAFSLTMQAQDADLRIAPKNQDQITLTWNTVAGSYYRLVTSCDAARLPSRWDNVLSAFGTGSLMTRDESKLSEQKFFRIWIPTNMLQGINFYVDPDSAAQTWVNDWTNTLPADAAEIDKIASRPWALWLTGDEGDVTNVVNDRIWLAEQQNQTALFCLYNLPLRACGSGGGAASASAYADWINGIKAGIGGQPAVIILEPNALAEMDCLSGIQQSERFSMLENAISVLRSEPNVVLYVDAGNPSWQSVTNMVQRLKAIGIQNAHGFALNTANFIPNADCISYGTQIAQQLGNIHFVIDTSRNGDGPSPDGQYCNPPGRALGSKPTTQTGVRLVDAFLWVKPPGESDGNCNGGPNVGTWWEEYALGLAQRASY